MAGGFAHIIMKKSMDKRLNEKLSRVDDILVFDADIPRNCTCSFVDFAPFVKAYKNENKSSEFSELVDFSNNWLKKNNSWDVISCETIPAIIEVLINSNGDIEHKRILNTYLYMTDEMSQKADMSYKLSNKMGQNREPIQFHVYILRLWIKRFELNPIDKIRPQLQFIDFLPKRFKENEFETIDAVIERVNQSIGNQEINGRIISVQTLTCSAQKDWSIDESSTQAKSWIGRFVIILRVYYLLGPIQEEMIGLTDFVPECLSGGSLFKKPKFESQTDVIKRASKWLTENPNFNFCNYCSIDFKLVKMVSDTKQMTISRDTGDFLRVIRLMYTKAKDSTQDIPSRLPLNMESRVFVLHKFNDDLKKTLSEFMSREEWTAQHLLLNSETVFLMSPNNQLSSLESNSEQSFQSITSSKISMNRNIYYAIKLYFNGSQN